MASRSTSQLLLRAALGAGLFLAWLGPARAGGPPPVPPGLPRYDLDIDLRLAEQRVIVCERVTWTNPSRRPTSEVVFNVSSHYSIPDKDVGFLAKMVEILRLAPSDALDFGGPACEVQGVTLVPAAPTRARSASAWTTQARSANEGTPPHVPVPFAFREDNAAALEVKLPHPVGPGESVTLELAFTLRLPQKQGRWGQWQGVTFLAQWLPVASFYDDKGWQPPPFIPWHQPFFNEAGVYRAWITLPSDQKLASTGSVASEQDLGDGRRLVEIGAVCARDFALFCSARFCEFDNTVNGTRIRCLAFPEHEFYARELIRTVSEALPVYSDWFGPYPYPEFTIVESYFGWNGNECGGLVMIDERVFDMPHVACNFVDYLMSHEFCHQWWYNVVGTNGYCETWMDEALAVYFSHRLTDCKRGKDDTMLTLPRGLGWLPNIRRADYRHYGLYGTMRRGEATATVQEMPKFGHLVTLFSMTYDRGGKIVGMIEARLGPDNMLDFMRLIYRKYAWRIIRVADFQRELEAFTGQSWEQFFKDWLYGAGASDWCVEDVKVEPLGGGAPPRCGPASWLLRPFRKRCADPCKVTVLLRQKGECNEPTDVGFRLDEGNDWQVRIRVVPNAGVLIDDQMAHVECGPENRVRVEVVLPCEPLQIAVDPDKVLLDRDPTNNCWKATPRVRFAPVYTALEETDLTNAYDRWNCIFGPWIYGASYNDPWYTRSTMVGVRAAAYRTQDTVAGAYAAYRTDDRNFVIGLDGLKDHWPFAHTQVGFNVEYAPTGIDNSGYHANSRAVLFGRYVLMYGDSLYLPPFHYVELFTSWQDNSLPDPHGPPPLDNPARNKTGIGAHYHLYLLTPYWNPEGGLAVDATYQEGFPILGAPQEQHSIFAQVSTVKRMPGWLDFLRDVPGMAWLMDTRWAFRAFGAAAAPNRGLFFTLGGGEQFRGFDLRERQGSSEWIGSVEWRVPLAQHLEWDCCDHVAGLRGLWLALFYDVGNTYVSNHDTGPVAHALGAGLRLDVAWFSLIERTTIRCDFAKTVNADSPWQFWFGVSHPF
jgi:hypothetical protein